MSTNDTRNEFIEVIGTARHEGRYGRLDTGLSGRRSAFAGAIATVLRIGGIEALQQSEHALIVAAAAQDTNAQVGSLLLEHFDQVDEPGQKALVRAAEEQARLLKKQRRNLLEADALPVLKTE